MSNCLASECSDDCESGWTLYLEQSFLPHPNPKHSDNSTGFVDAKSTGFCRKGKNTKEDCEEEDEGEEEEDLSMVSDASSGPPHFHEDESHFNHGNGFFYPSPKDTTLLNNGANYGQKKKEHRRHKQDQQMPSFLDDTASSPAFNFSMNNSALSNNQASMESVLDYSQGTWPNSLIQGSVCLFNIKISSDGDISSMLNILAGKICKIKTTLVTHTLLYLETNFKIIR
ncbi:hypothetical protein NC653_023208 [Populus alba x Populus x berolinensis]|uniref:Uncharacterized protein n=1 Tax=Populus alba x Populus x berolinensis TaxID=444605 RepID=A0AAD6MGM6_9ROSI|nr:hypothetical protein NC653_023208 [Populus alba x Populus x berolinensis]